MNADGKKELDRLRKGILEVDAQILQLAARRIALARSIGELKFREGLPIQDYSVEKRVIEEARRLSESLGIPAETGEGLMKPLIRSAIRAQEQDRAQKLRVSGGSALLIGGSGRMGQWFGRYLESLGYRILVDDPAPTPPGMERAGDRAAAVADASLVVVATPPSITRDVLAELARTPGEGLLFDISSLKSPLVESLRALARSGRKVTSLHPMFGPSADLLTGRKMVICDCGSARANREARALFADTTVGLVDMPLEEHDPLITFVLGLSHAVNLIFNGVLSSSDRTMGELEHLASTTFDAQVRIAGAVALENPDLYYEIQAMNDHTPGLLSALQEQMDLFRAVVERRDRKGFRAMMAKHQRFYQGAGT